MKLLIIKTFFLAVTIALSAIAVISQSDTGQGLIKGEKYSNELPEFHFYEKAKWKELKPLVATMTDVRKVLGKPDEECDVSQYTQLYPGDDKAKQPVLTYNLDADWKVLIYFVKYCFRGYGNLPKELNNTVCSIDLIPRKPLSFKSVVFPSVFEKTPVQAVDAAWNEYSDKNGLIYEVYTTHTQYGHTSPGDLNRISYTAADAIFKKYSSDAK